jgi:hypothetical protein
VDGLISGASRGSTPLGCRSRAGGRRGTPSDCQSHDHDERERQPGLALHSHRLNVGTARASFNASSGDIYAHWRNRVDCREQCFAIDEADLGAGTEAHFSARHDDRRRARS